MSNFIEFEADKKKLKAVVLDDYSIEDLEEYIEKLKEEISRSQLEIKKRLKTKDEANKLFI